MLAVFEGRRTHHTSRPQPPRRAPDTKKQTSPKPLLALQLSLYHPQVAQMLIILQSNHQVARSWSRKEFGALPLPPRSPLFSRRRLLCRMYVNPTLDSIKTLLQLPTFLPLCCITVG